MRTKSVIHSTHVYTYVHFVLQSVYRTIHPQLSRRCGRNWTASGPLYELRHYVVPLNGRACPMDPKGDFCCSRFEHNPFNRKAKPTQPYHASKTGTIYRPSIPEEAATTILVQTISGNHLTGNRMHFQGWLSHQQHRTNNQVFSQTHRANKQSNYHHNKNGHVYRYT